MLRFRYVYRYQFTFKKCHHLFTSIIVIDFRSLAVVLYKPTLQHNMEKQEMYELMTSSLCYGRGYDWKCCTRNKVLQKHHSVSAETNQNFLQKKTHSFRYSVYRTRTVEPFPSEINLPDSITYHQTPIVRSARRARFISINYAGLYFNRPRRTDNLCLIIHCNLPSTSRSYK